MVICFFMLVVSLAAGKAAEPEKEKRTNVTVTVELLSAGKRYDPRVRIKNNETKPLALTQDAVPWWHPDSMIIVARRVVHVGSEIRELSRIADPIMRGPVGSLAAGESISGDLSLNERFPDLPSILTRHDVIVFWSYRLDPWKAPPSEYFGGWFVLRRAGR